MRVGFAGTPAFAAHVLDALLASGFGVPLVLTQPDRPKGRGLKLEASPVKERALASSIPVAQPATLRSEGARAELTAVPLDALVVVAYGLLLPPAILAWPRQGCINVHASLLPRWRGAAPIQRAIMAGDAETGVSIMRMDAGLDTGPVFCAERVPITARETAGTLHDRLAHAGAHALIGVLERFARGENVTASPQPAQGVTCAGKISNADQHVDWRASAQGIDRQVRALHPAPGAVTMLAGKPVRIIAAEPLENAAGGMRAGAPPGTVIEAGGRGLVVACGEGALRLLEVQPAGGRSMSSAAFVAGRRIAAGARFD